MNLTNKFRKLTRTNTDPLVKFPELLNLNAAARERGWEYHEILPASIQTCYGARAISEDFLQWVDRGPELVKVHRDAHRGESFGRFWASHLHSVRRYPADPVFHCTVPDATLLLDDGGVLTDRGELAREAYFLFQGIRESQWQKGVNKTLKGRFISLLTSYGDRNIGHFFFDAMFRVALFDQLSDFQFLVPPKLHPWHRGLIEAVGIEPHQMVHQEEPGTRVEELVVCHTAQQGYMPRRELIAKFREKVLGRLPQTPPTRPFRRLFTDRSAMKQRRMINQKELEPILKDRGFEMVRWETLTVQEQATLAMETEIMAGPHGSHMINGVFCSPGTKVLEIMNPPWWDGSNLRQSTLAGHEFWYTFGENASKDYDTYMDPRKLERVLDYMLDAPVTDPGPG